MLTLHLPLLDICGLTSFFGLNFCRNFPISHAAADAPICIECQALEMNFYDPNCKGCRSELADRSHVGVPHVMAILRQWVPQVGIFSSTGKLISVENRLKNKISLKKCLFLHYKQYLLLEIRDQFRSSIQTLCVDCLRSRDWTKVSLVHSFICNNLLINVVLYIP